MFCASFSWLHASSWDTCKYRGFGVKQVGEFWAVMTVGHLWDKQVSSAQILMSCIGLTWYQPVLLCYNRSFQTTCSIICCSIKGAEEFHLVTSFCYRFLTLWIRVWLSHLYFRWQWGERKDRQNVVSKPYPETPQEQVLWHIFPMQTSLVAKSARTV